MVFLKLRFSHDYQAHPSLRSPPLFYSLCTKNTQALSDEGVQPPNMAAPVRELEAAGAKANHVMDALKARRSDVLRSDPQLFSVSNQRVKLSDSPLRRVLDEC